MQCLLGLTARGVVTNFTLRYAEAKNHNNKITQTRVLKTTPKFITLVEIIKISCKSL